MGGDEHEGTSVDLWQSVQVLLRRWYVFVPTSVIGVLMALAVSNGIDPEYRASGSLLLMVPSTQTAEDGSEVSQNPYLSFSASLATTAAALQLAILDGEASSTLAAENLATDFQVIVERRSPILRIEVVADDAMTPPATVARVSELLQNSLDRRQETAGVPPPDRIRFDVLQQTRIGVSDTKAQSRARILMVGLGVLAGVGAAFALEGVARARRARAEKAALSVSSPLTTVSAEEATKPGPRNETRKLRVSGG